MKYIIRKLNKKDLQPQKGFIRTLACLTEVKEMSYEELLKIFKEIKKEHSTIFVAVSQEKETKGQIIGTVKFVRDQKFARGGALSAHLEDFVTRKGYKGQGVAGSLWLKFLEHARELGCYKIILDCSKDLVPFYEKLGYYEFSVCMRIEP